MADVKIWLGFEKIQDYDVWADADNTERGFPRDDSKGSDPGGGGGGRQTTSHTKELSSKDDRERMVVALVDDPKQWELDLPVIDVGDNVPNAPPGEPFGQVTEAWLIDKQFIADPAEGDPDVPPPPEP